MTRKALLCVTQILFLIFAAAIPAAAADKQSSTSADTSQEVNQLKVQLADQQRQIEELRAALQKLVADRQQAAPDGSAQPASVQAPASGPPQLGQVASTTPIVPVAPATKGAPRTSHARGGPPADGHGRVAVTDSHRLGHHHPSRFHGFYGRLSVDQSGQRYRHQLRQHPVQHARHWQHQRISSERPKLASGPPRRCQRPRRQCAGLLGIGFSGTQPRQRRGHQQQRQPAAAALLGRCAKGQGRAVRRPVLEYADAQPEGPFGFARRPVSTART